ncbi:hypothetical protein ACWDNI_02930 [Nocardia niigatensis]
MAHSMPAATKVTDSAAGAANAGLAAAAFNAARQLDSALGVAVLGALIPIAPGSLALPLATAAAVYLLAAVPARSFLPAPGRL